MSKGTPLPIITPYSKCVYESNSSRANVDTLQHVLMDHLSTAPQISAPIGSAKVCFTSVSLEQQIRPENKTNGGPQHSWF